MHILAAHWAYTEMVRKQYASIITTDTVCMCGHNKNDIFSIVGRYKDDNVSLLGHNKDGTAYVYEHNKDASCICIGT